jgi:hypothetical protein
MNSPESVLDKSIKHLNELESEARLIYPATFITAITLIIVVIASFYYSNLFVFMIFMVIIEPILIVYAIRICLGIYREKNVQELLITGHIPTTDEES